jgi:predicted HicB family RNase H-like nuclease
MEPVKEKKVSITARIKKEIKTGAEKKAERKDRSLSYIVEKALQEYIKKP